MQNLCMQTWSNVFICALDWGGLRPVYWVVQWTWSLGALVHSEVFLEIAARFLKIAKDYGFFILLWLFNTNQTVSEKTCCFLISTPSKRRKQNSKQFKMENSRNHKRKQRSIGITAKTRRTQHCLLTKQMQIYVCKGAICATKMVWSVYMRAVHLSIYMHATPHR